MDRTLLLKYLHHPDQLGDLSFETIRQLLLEYPYAQNLHFLLAKKSHQENHPDFERHLRQTATYFNSRTFLHQRLHQEPLTKQPVTASILPSTKTETAPKVPPVKKNDPLVVAPLIPPTTATTNVQDQVDSVNDVNQVEKSDRIPPKSKINEPLDQKKAELFSESTEKKKQTDEPIPPRKRIIRSVRRIPLEETVADDHPSSKPLVSDPEAVAPVQSLESVAPLPDEMEHTTAADEMEILLAQPLIEVIPGNPNPTKDFILALDEEEEEEDLFFDDLELPSTEEIAEMEEEHEKKNKIKNKPRPKLEKWIEKYEATRADHQPNKIKKKKKKKKKGGKRSTKATILAELREEIGDAVPEEKAKKSRKKKKKKKGAAKKAKRQKVTPKEIKSTHSVGDNAVAKSSKKVKKKSKKKKKSKFNTFANQSIQTNNDIVSETLADLLAQQGSTEKAIEMYERLCLIFPEKKAFFAAHIKKLKKN